MTTVARRTFIAQLAALLASGQQPLPPVRALTRGPRHHWFGYYDKLEFDPTSRYVLGMSTAFENRSPQPDDVIRVGLIDTKDKDRWKALGESRAWCWQQGCMLQWLPGSKTDVIWNDRDGDRFVSRILNVKTGRKRTLPMPVYAISPDARWAIAPDFRRLHHLRPGYGYAGIPDPHREVDTPRESGIWRMNLETGKVEMLFSVADIAGMDNRLDTAGAKHWFNHLLYSPDGTRFVFLHRWRGPKQGTSFATRMITCDANGGDRYALDPHGKTSHFIWRDPQHILAWAYHPSRGEKFYLYRDKSEHTEVVGPDVMTVNGHCTYLPGNEWILNDTYPDKERKQHPYLFRVKTGERIPLGHFDSPAQYTGEWRCDNHPRFSPDGRSVVIDSPHGGNGRQLYLIDISTIVG